MKGVLDRVEANHMAVILIEDIGEQFVVPVHDLPEGSKEGTWFTIKKHHGEFIVVEIDQEKTNKEIKKSSDLLTKLRSKTATSRFKRRGDSNRDE